MKTLLLMICPLFLFAQLPPNLIPPYVNPNNVNSLLDSTYVPATSYRMDEYRLAPNKIDLEWSSRYEIETDNYQLIKNTQYKPNAYYDVYATSYNYLNNRVTSIEYRYKQPSESTIQLRGIDSFVYQNGLVKIKENWSINPDSNTIEKNSGIVYTYDSTGTYMASFPYNANIPPSTIYTGFIKVDSLAGIGLPAKISTFSFSDKDTTSNAYYIIQYDNLNRPGSVLGFTRPFPNGSYYEMDSIVYYYTNTKKYPDSVLKYSPTLLDKPKKLQTKEIYLFDSEGKIKEKLTYSMNGNGTQTLSQKQVFSKILSGLTDIKQEQPEFSIYPNPSNGYFTIDLKNNFSQATITLSNMLGVTYLRQSFEPNEPIVIQQPNLGCGIYLLSVATEIGISTQKIVVR